MNKIRALEFFIASIDGQSFAAAAQHYGTDPSTVSKAIARLEQSLGLQLLQRSTRHFTITTIGQQYYGIAKKLLEELLACESSLKQQNETVEGLLKISLPVSYGRLYILPWIRGFRNRFPNVLLDIHFDDGYTDIIDNGFDIAIRSGTVKDSQLIARQLSPTDFILCASPEYIQQQTIAIAPKNYAEHPWIRFRYKQTGKLLELVSASKKPTSLNKLQRVDFIVNDGEAMAELCAAGVGLTQLPHFIARKWLQDFQPTGTSNPVIQAIGRSQRQVGSGVYLLYPKRDYLPAKVNVFIKYVIEQLAEIGETPTNTWAAQLNKH